MAGFGWSLSRPNFFEKFRDISSVSRLESSTNHATSGNILFISEDLCYIWCSSRKTLVRSLCSDIWINNDEGNFQEWPLSEQLHFHITHLSGRNFPREIFLVWGPGGLASLKYHSNSGSKNPSLNCTIIGEKIYLEHWKLRILQVKWHPTTKQDIVAVLNNDYYIRLYDLNDPKNAISVVCVGPQESIPFTYGNNSVGLTEPPVDFEFGQRLSKSGLWTLFILKSSGTISYLLLKIIGTTNMCLWEAEKIIYTDGNLDDAFEEAASILITKTFPLIFTIACLNGNLYHAVLLPSESDAIESTDLNMEEKLLNGDVTLFLKEILELEPDNEGGFISIRLIQDPICTHRYACVHDEGVHLINMHFVGSITNFLASGETDSELSVSSYQKSSVRYVLCTKTGGGDTTLLAHELNVAFSESIPQKFLLLLGNGETLVYEIPHALDNFRMLQEKEDDLTSNVLESASISSEGGSQTQDEDVGSINTLDVVKKLLSKNVNQPYLMAWNNEELPNEKNEALLLSGMRVLKFEYLQRQEQAMLFLMESLKTLEGKAVELKEPVEKLMTVQSNLRNAAESIAELYEEGKEREDGIHKRLETILFQHHQAFPMITDDEKNWLRTMEALQIEVRSMNLMVEGLKKITSGKPLKLERSNEVQNILSTTQIMKIRVQILEHHKTLAILAHSIKEFEKKMNLS